MKKTKFLFVILIVMLICCPYSVARPYSIGYPSAEAAKNIPNSAYYPGILGTITTGASIPVLDEFVCNLMSACGMYPRGLANNGDGATVNLAEFSFGKISP